MGKTSSGELKPLSAVQKTCRILSNVTDPARSRLTDISERAGLDVSTTFRILKELESEGFVERDSETKCYTLGPQAYVMHHAMVGGLDIKAAARPSLIRLARQFGDSVILSLPMGWESVCVDMCLGDYPIRANYLNIGSRRPLGVGAGSLALYAALPENQQEAVLPHIRQALEQHYPDYPFEQMLEESEKAKKSGYTLLLDVVVHKMGGVGKVVYGPGGRPIAALSIAALRERITGREHDLATALEAEAQLIGRSWLPQL